MTTARVRSRRSASSAPSAGRPSTSASSRLSPSSRPSPVSSSVAEQPRLPWWAAALPVLAFALLLSLLLGGTGASAAQQQAESAGAEVVAAVLERVAQALLG
jgi:hypothetical protein